MLFFMRRFEINQNNLSRSELPPTHLATININGLTHYLFKLSNTF